MAIWKRLAHVKLTSAGDTIDTGTFDAAENLKVVYFGISSSGINGYMRFNGFSDQSYSIRLSDSGAADGAYDDRTMLAHDTGTATTNQYSVSYITNQSDQEKIVHGTVINSQGSATNTAPTRRELIGKFE